MRLTLVDRGGRTPRWPALLARHAGLMTGAVALCGLFASSLDGRAAVQLLYGLSVLFAVASALVVLVRRDGRGLHDLLSGVSNESTWRPHRFVARGAVRSGNGRDGG
jgi:hypothetical protein